MRSKNKEIILNGQKVAYCLKTSARTRNLRVVVKSGGEVFASKPELFPDFLVERFLRQKSEWVLGKIAESKSQKSLLPPANRREFLKHRPAARILVSDKIAELRAVYNLRHNRVAIRNQRTRWGSCSAKGNLNFNYRMVFLPDRLAGYVVAHELCHLKEFNHSPRFWALLAIAFPDQKNLRRELKNYRLS
jgi:hypothetical protein